MAEDIFEVKRERFDLLRPEIYLLQGTWPEGYRVENKPPPRGKDVNDFLCHRLGIPIRGSHGKEPER